MVGQEALTGCLLPLAHLIKEAVRKDSLFVF